MSCPSCGTPQVRPDQRFCARCGTALAEQPPPADPAAAPPPLFADELSAPPPLPPRPPASPPPPTVTGPFVPPVSPVPPTPPARRRAGGLVLLLVLVLVAVGIGATGAVLLLRGDDVTAAADDESRRAPGPRDGPVSELSASPVDETEVTNTVAPPAFRCWDGMDVGTLAECRAPTGADGLSWVFGGSTGGQCVVVPDPGRLTEVDCYPSQAGGQVRVHYSEWRSREALEEYYAGNLRSVLAPPAPYLEAWLLDASVDHKVVVFYDDPAARWSVTVYAETEAQYRSVVEGLEPRPARWLAGERAG